MSKKRGLGKGLGALLENSDTDIVNISGARDIEDAVVGTVSKILISSIEANPFQPRTKFEKEPLLELSESIKKHGIIQPVTVRKLGANEYQLISGERRFRASQLAGLKEIPAYVRLSNDQEMLEMALVENIQRENLDAIEIALSYQRLLDECQLTQEELSEKVSKKRSTISNYLRLLKLPASIQLGIREKAISMGHARALLGVDDPLKQEELFLLIRSKSLSVRQTESLVQEQQEKPKTSASKSNTQFLSFEHLRLKDDLNKRLGTKVDLSRDQKGKGKITINFTSDEELQRIIETLEL